MSARRRVEGDMQMDPGHVVLKAAFVGIAVAAPVVPMSLLCMRQSLASGWRNGLLAGLGIATGDCTYALIAAACLSGLSHFLLLHARPLHFAAALALFYFGVSGLRCRATERAPSAGRSSYFGSVLLTLTNPATSIAFAAFFTGLTPLGGRGFTAAGLTAGGVFAGSLLWWCGLVAVICIFRTTIGRRAQRLIERVAGVFFLAFGIFELRRALAR